MITENSNGRDVAATINDIKPGEGIGGGLVKLRVGTYNIGHFALGKSSGSSVTNDTLAGWVAKYHSAMNDAGLDVLCAQEYEPDIVRGKPAKDYVFENFKYNGISTKVAYNCNAIFSNVKMAQAVIVNFEQAVQSGRNYIYTTIKLGGHDVKIASAHFDFQGSNGTAIRQAQMRQIISAFAADDYVIICADFNINNDNLSDWDIMRNAGYTLANMGYAGEIITCPYTAGTTTVIDMKLDNICVKGFAVSEVKTFGTLDMSDHYGLQATLTMLEP